MGGGKTESDVKLALRYSLTIGSGATDKVRVGWWKESVDNPSERVVQMRTGYGTLADTFKQIDDLIGKIPGGARSLPGRRDSLRDELARLENTDVPNLEDKRIAMLAAIKDAQDIADALLKDAQDLSRLPVAGFANLPQAPVSVRPGEVITLSTFGVTTVPPNLPLELRLSEKTPQNGEIAFDKLETRNLFLVVPDTDPAARGTTAKIQVKVEATLREIAIGKPPPPAVVWGTPLTAETLAATATGPGSSVTLLLGETQIGPKDFLPVGTHTLTLRAEPTGKSAWRTGEKSFDITVTPRPRAVTCATPLVAVKVDDVLDARTLGATLWLGASKSKQKVDDEDIEVSVPAAGVFTAVGAGQTITFRAPPTATDAEATFSTTIDVTINAPVLTWPQPKPRSLDEKNRTLAPSLAARIAPDKLKKDLVYTPDGTTALTEGVIALKVDYPGSALYAAASASARLTVFASKSKADGFAAMQSGAAFSRPTDVHAKARLDQWDNPNDPQDLAKKGREIMGTMKTQTKAEMLVYLRAFNGKPGVAFNETGSQIEVNFLNGLRLRYKFAGSTGSGGKPTFCMEVMKQVQQVGVPPQQNVAFKVTAEGKAAAKGPSDYQRPGGMKPELETADFIDGAHAATHLLPVGA